MNNKQEWLTIYLIVKEMNGSIVTLKDTLKNKEKVLYDAQSAELLAKMLNLSTENKPSWKVKRHYDSFVQLL